MARFNKGDKVNHSAIGVATVASWPEDDEGYAVFEQYYPNAEVAVRRTDYIGPFRDGAAGEQVKLTPYTGDEGHALALAVQAPADLDEVQSQITDSLIGDGAAVEPDAEPAPAAK